MERTHVTYRKLTYIMLIICIGFLVLFGATYGDTAARKRDRLSSNVDSSELSVPESQNIGNSDATSSVRPEETRHATETNYEKSPRRRKDRRRKKPKNGRLERENRKNYRKRDKDNAQGSDENENIGEVLRNTMKHMFGFNHIPITTPPKAAEKIIDPDLDIASFENTGGDTEEIAFPGDGDMMPQPPDFMLELYRTYSQDNNLMMLHSISQGNTVRSFFPASADPSERLNNRKKAVTITPVDTTTNQGSNSEPEKTHQPHVSFPVFLFNLSSIPSPETLVRAEIRLDGLSEAGIFKSQPGNEETNNETSENVSPVHNWNIIVGVYKIESNDCADGLDCRNKPRKIYYRMGNTTALNSADVATWSARELLRLATKARKQDHFLIVRFESGPEERLSRPSRHVENHENFGNDLPLQFTINDNERLKRDSDMARNNMNSGDSTTRDKWLDINFNHSPTTPILIIYCNDSRTAIVRDSPAPAAPNIWGALENMTEQIKKRVRRSESTDLTMDEVKNNLVMGEYVDEEDAPSERIQRNLRKSQPQVVDKYRSGKKVDDRKGKNATKIKNTITNEKTSRIRKRNQKCNGKKKKGKKGCKKTNRGRKKQKKVPFHPTAVERVGECGRKSLNVDFASIGWSDWIISPTTFEAYYCTGRCGISNMQVNKNHGMSNHAIIQTIARLSGSNVPEPCCVPDKLMPLSVLFFDENTNVVLKVYPNMSVETCACK